jgi:hypothetical protein
MTTEQVKSKLKSIRCLKIRLLALKRRIDELEAEIDGVSAVDYGKVKVKSSGGNTTEKRYLKCVDRIVELQKQYETLFGDLCALEDELGERMRQRLNPTEYQVIYERYINGVKPFSIHKAAVKFGYTEDAIKAIQRRSFKKMSDDEEVKKIA